MRVSAGESRSERRRLKKIGGPRERERERESCSGSDYEIGTRERASGCIQVSEARRKRELTGEWGTVP